MSILASCGRSVKFHSWPSGAYLGRYDPDEEITSLRTISWCKTGEHVVAVPDQGKPIVIKFLETSSETCPDNTYLIHKIPNVTSKVTGADFSKNHSTAVALGTQNGEIYVFDLTTGEVINWYPTLFQEIDFLEFSKQDELLAAASETGPIVLYNSRNIVCQSFMVPNSLCLSAMRLHQNHPDLLAGGSCEGAVCVWDIEKGNILLSEHQHKCVVSDVAFHPQGQLFASVGIDKKFVCYDLRLPRFPHYMDMERELTSIAFMPDDKELAIACADGYILCYDMRNSRAPLLTVKAHNNPVTKVTFQSRSTQPNCPLEEESRSVSSDCLAEDEVRKERPGDNVANANADEDAGLPEAPNGNDERLRKMHEKFSSFEDQVYDAFYKLRLDTIKFFIGLEKYLKKKGSSVNKFAATSKTCKSTPVKSVASTTNIPGSKSSFRRRCSSTRDINTNI